MSSKHVKLRESELDNYSVDEWINQQIDNYVNKNKITNKKDVRILELGCGRGKAVIKLLERGYSVYGVDIDEKVLKKGSDLFRKKGFDPDEILLNLKDIQRFKDGYFNIIFSEQVFEHIADLDDAIKLHKTHLLKGGMGLHVFPSAKTIIECHVCMPFIHWLPKHKTRKLYIALMCLMRFKPKNKWPETEGKHFWEEVSVYYNYLEEKTHYRDNDNIRKLFTQYGFEVEYFIKGLNSKWRKYLPAFLKRNGFPDQNVRFQVIKK